MNGRTTVQYLVIVHPAGQLDHPNQSRYWTEVPSLPACMGAGGTLEEAVHDTRVAIASTRRRRTAEPDGANRVDLPEVDVQLGF
jgi:predicted RNase H-like HicB family nuclease